MEQMSWHELGVEMLSKELDIGKKEDTLSHATFWSLGVCCLHMAV